MLATRSSAAHFLPTELNLTGQYASYLLPVEDRPFKAITSEMPNEAPVTQKELREVIAAQLKLMLELTAGFHSLVAVLEEKGTFSRADLKLALEAVQESTNYRRLHKRVIEVQDAESLENFLQGFEGTIQ